jgi:uncharacterized protein (TIGR01244 family)
VDETRLTARQVTGLRTRPSSSAFCRIYQNLHHSESNQNLEVSPAIGVTFLQADWLACRAAVRLALRVRNRHISPDNDKEPCPMFRKLTDTVLASPQIGLDDIAQARALGVTLIINNRPEHESDDQTPGAAIAAAAQAAGMAYVAIPVTHAGFSESQVTAMAAALAGAEGPVLAYCRSGTRSTLLWAMAQASRGGNPADLAAQAAQAGYDITPVRAMVDMLAARES